MTSRSIALAILCTGLLSTGLGFAAQPAMRGVTDQAVAALCDKRIAMLGELPSHGEGQAFRLKADIARALVERCGFDAVLFEAPIYDFVGMEHRWGTDSATRLQLDKAIGRFWWARELADFRRWLFDAAHAGRLRVGGLDDQVSITSDHARAALPGLVASSVPDSEEQACRASVERNLGWTYDATHAWDDEEKRLLQACSHTAARATDPAATRVADGEAARMLANYSGYVQRQAESPDVPDRDLQMHRNLSWYLERFPPDAKIIVWTATVHGAKRSGTSPHKPLGRWAHDQWDSQLGSVGFTAFAGSSSMAGRPPKPLDPASPQSLEARALEPDAPATYLDAAALAKFGEIESRLFGKVTVADWSTQFDGVVVIREESPATFEKLD
jgi:erythromycin esterase-like protein